MRKDRPSFGTRSIEHNFPLIILAPPILRSLPPTALMRNKEIPFVQFRVYDRQSKLISIPQLQTYKTLKPTSNNCHINIHLSYSVVFTQVLKNSYKFWKILSRKFRETSTEKNTFFLSSSIIQKFKSVLNNYHWMCREICMNTRSRECSGFPKKNDYRLSPDARLFCPTPV